MTTEQKRNIINRLLDNRESSNAATLAKCWSGQFDSKDALREYQRAERNFEHALIRAGVLN